MFIRPESDPEKSRVRSLHTAHQPVEAKPMNPAAIASSTIATLLSVVWLPSQSNVAEEVKPTHTALRRPLRRPRRRAAASETSPPNGGINGIARNGVDPQRPP